MTLIMMVVMTNTRKIVFEILVGIAMLWVTWLLYLILGDDE